MGTLKESAFWKMEKLTGLATGLDNSHKLIE
jgi:hypothetical protein